MAIIVKMFLKDLLNYIRNTWKSEILTECLPHMRTLDRVPLLFSILIQSGVEAEFMELEITEKTI